MSAERMKSRAPERTELEALIERARNHVMSPEEREAQQRSWVIGNVMLSNPDMTRARANQVYDEIVGKVEHKDENAALREALKPLAAIADVYDENGLDEERPDWRERNIGDMKPYDQIELYSGRGGRRLLTLADAFAAREALKK